MSNNINDIAENFALLADWTDRYKYVIELGNELAPYPEDKRDETHKIAGCVSQVWLSYSVSVGDDPVVTFWGDSDAHIVRGLVFILLTLYSGKRASEILKIDPDKWFQTLGLDENLTKQRSNGLRAMVARIRHEAQLILN